CRRIRPGGRQERVAGASRSARRGADRLASTRGRLGATPLSRVSRLVTYIIAEPCIDIKDLSCVDVCPVDCIHQAERILIIDPEECIDCFAPTEEFLTPYGLRTFAEMENTACRVLTDDGFRPAYVRRFRRKPLVEVTFAPAFEERDRYGGTRLTTRDISKFRRSVLATPTHSWFLADGEQTDSLAAGQFVPSSRARPRRDSETYRLGVVHGLVFGDGTWDKHE